MDGQLIRISSYADETAARDPHAVGPAGILEARGRDPVLEIAPGEHAPRRDETSSLEAAGTGRWPGAGIGPAAAARPARSWLGRGLALVVLVATLGSLGWAGLQVYYVVADGWIAPLHLSPDSEAVTQLRLAHQRHLSELARLDAEITRLDGELAAIDGAVTQLSRLRDVSQDTLAWDAAQSQVETRGLDDELASYARQRATLTTLHARQQVLVERTAQDLAAGLIDRTAYDREQQVLDQLALALDENDRAAAEARVKRDHSRAALEALRTSARRTPGARPGAAQMPEVAAGAEHSIRVEVEIQRLRAEARGQRALREAAVASVSSERALLEELEARPLYRAMTVATDIGFAPYNQLVGVRPGDAVVQCTWGVFGCHPVGRIAEIVSGEIATQDPWGELARGQYVVLTLDDSSAVRERVLRVRH